MLVPILAALAACSGTPGPEVGGTVLSARPSAPASTSSKSRLSDETGYFRPVQAVRGKRTFAGVCSECHSNSDFRGRDFEWNWRRQTVRNLYAEMSQTMPEDDPGSLTDEQYIDVIAYILELNDYPSGEVALSATNEVMDLVPLGPNARRLPQEQP